MSATSCKTHEMVEIHMWRGGMGGHIRRRLRSSDGPSTTRACGVPSYQPTLHRHYPVAASPDGLQVALTGTWLIAYTAISKQNAARDQYTSRRRSELGNGVSPVSGTMQKPPSGSAVGVRRAAMQDERHIV